MGLSKDYEITGEYICGYIKTDPFTLLVAKDFEANNVDHLKVLVHCAGVINEFRQDRCNTALSMIEDIVENGRVAETKDNVTMYHPMHGILLGIEDTGCGLQLYHASSVIFIVQAYLSDALFDKLNALDNMSRAKISALIVELYKKHGSISENMEDYLNELIGNVASGIDFSVARMMYQGKTIKKEKEVQRGS